MNDEAGHSIQDDTSSHAGKWILLALAVIYIAGSLYFLFDLRGRVTALSGEQDASKAQIADLGKRIQSADAQKRSPWPPDWVNQERACFASYRTSTAAAGC